MGFPDMKTLVERIEFLLSHPDTLEKWVGAYDAETLGKWLDAEIGDRRRRLDRRTALLAGVRHDTAGGLQDEVHARLLRHRAGLAEGGDRAVHQARIDAAGNRGLPEQGQHALEVGLRGGAEKIDQLRRALGDLLQRRILGVEDAQRVGVQAAARIFVEFLDVSFEIGDEFGAMPGTLFRLPERVDFEADAGQADDSFIPNKFK
jgi:hypothetical protein